MHGTVVERFVRSTVMNQTVHGIVLATLREEAGLLQRDLAELVGRTQGWLSHVEHHRNRVSPQLLGRLAAVLTERLGRPITVDDLLVDCCPTCYQPLAQTA